MWSPRRFLMPFCAVLALVFSGFVAVPVSTVSADAGGAVDASRTVAGTLSGATNHTCLTKHGKVYCWGSNTLGQLLMPSANPSGSVPQVVSGVSDVESVSAGGGQSCAVQPDRKVLCWGNQGGHENPNIAIIPTKIQRTVGASSVPIDDAVYVAVGGNGTGTDTGCVITTSSSLWCWGENSGGQVGNNSSTDITAAVQVISPEINSSGVKAVSVGPNHSCAVLIGGTVQCWGGDSAGQLGDGLVAQPNYTFQPVTVSGVTGAVGISVNWYHSCALLSSGGAQCWGANWDGQLGDTASFGGQVPSPVSVGGLTDIVAISAGGSHTCAVKQDGAVWCWGDNTTLQGGRVGLESAAPIVVSGISGATAVSAGNGHSCALVGTNDLKCWGDASSGKLGDGTAVNRSTPGSVAKKVTQSISMSTIGTKTVNDTTVSLVGIATSTSGADVVYSNASDNSGICDVAGSQVTILGPGSCKVQADAPAYGFYMGVGDTQTFTIAGAAPTVETGTAPTVGIRTATLTAAVNARFISTTTTFSYSTNENLVGATQAPAVAAVSSGTAVTVSTDVTGLTPATTYYYRASATNTAGTGIGTVKSFTTGGTKPTVATTSATSVSANKATLNATVNANDVDTTVTFTYGKTKDLSGETTTLAAKEVTGSVDEGVSVTITKLDELVTYYFRVDATNALGASRGEIKSFTTARPVGMTINNAAEFTNKKNVVLSVTGTSGSVTAIVSNDGGFGKSESFDLIDGSAEISWTLVASRDERLPKQVYVKFVSRFGTQSSNYQDDIILDTTAPVLAAATASASTAPAAAVTVQAVRAPKKKNGAKILVRASDKNSGVGTIEVRSSAKKKPTKIVYAKPKAASQWVTVKTTAKKLQVRVLDRAGNASPWKTVTVR